MAGWHHQLDGHDFESTLGVGDDWVSWHVEIHGVGKSQTRLSDCTELTDPWRGAWQPTPVFLPGESPWNPHGGLKSMGSKSQDTTEQLN